MIPRAIFFDVDFTLIYPGPTFQAEGYRRFAERHGLRVDEAAFEQAVSSAAPLLNGPDEAYDAELFVQYAAHIIEEMGGRGDGVDACAREVYREWAACQHFELYDDVPEALRALAATGVQIGLISNSHRCLASFQSHFDLRGLITAAVSSLEHGYLKPNPSIFHAALQRVNVPAADAVMVGDNVRQDVEGALAVGMRAVLLHRAEAPPARARDLVAAGVPVVRSLRDLSAAIRGLPTHSSPQSPHSPRR